MLDLATSGFICPQDDLIKLLKVANQVFEEIHGRGFLKSRKGDVETLMQAFKEREELKDADESILRLFADRRLDIRVSYINGKFRRHDLWCKLKNHIKVTHHMT